MKRLTERSEPPERALEGQAQLSAAMEAKCEEEEGEEGVLGDADNEHSAGGV